MLTRLRRKGYTLLELICVITVMGILAALVAIKTDSVTAGSVVTEAERMRRQISHVQAMASQWGIALRIDLIGSNGYAVRCLTAHDLSPCPTGVTPGVTIPTDPATGEAMSTVLAAGITITGASIAFDSMGRPYSGATPLTTNATYTLSGGGHTRTVTIAPITGFVQAS